MIQRFQLTKKSSNTHGTDIYGIGKDKTMKNGQHRSLFYSALEAGTMAPRQNL